MARLHGKIAVAALAAALIGAPAASVALTDDVGAISSEAGAATEGAVKALPSLPDPVEAPRLPEVPAPAPPPPPPPASSPSPPASTPTSSVPEPTAAGPSGGGGEMEEAPTPSATEGAPPASPGPIAAGEPGGGAVTVKSGQRSIGPTETPSTLRWRAYVWPAIALRIENAIAPLMASLEGLAGAPVAGVFESFLSPPAPGVVTVGRLSESHAPTGQSARSPTEFGFPDDQMGLLGTLLIGLLVLACLASLAKELSQARAWRWRGHRG